MSDVDDPELIGIVSGQPQDRAGWCDIPVDVRSGGSTSMRSPQQEIAVHEA